MKTRESSFELLRLIAILMVVVGHINGIAFDPISHADVLSSPVTCFSRMFLGRLCVIGVDIFILISGYFSIKPKLKSILNFAFLIFFWRVLMYVVQGTLGYFEFRASTAVAMINPLKIWFIRDYVTLMIMAPMLNTFCEKLTDRQLLKAIGVYYIIAFVADYVIPLKYWGLMGGGYSAMWFFGLYMIGRYLGMYGLGRWNISIRRLNLIYCGVSLLSAAILFTAVYISANTWVRDKVGCVLSYYTSPFVLLAAIAVFMIFAKLHFTSRFVNYAAMSVFPIYLSHSPTKWFWRTCHDIASTGGGERYIG